MFCSTLSPCSGGLYFRRRRFRCQRESRPRNSSRASHWDGLIQLLFRWEPSVKEEKLIPVESRRELGTRENEPPRAMPLNFSATPHERRGHRKLAQSRPLPHKQVRFEVFTCLLFLTRGDVINRLQAGAALRVGVND